RCKVSTAWFSTEIESAVGTANDLEMSVSPTFGRSNLKFTPRRSITTFCGQPSGPTIVPAAVSGHLSSQSFTPSWSLSMVEQSAGAGAGATAGAGAAAGAPKRETTLKPRNQSP